MGRKKKSYKEHPLFEYEYEREVTYHCPKRGEVTETVKVKRYKSKMDQYKESIAPKVDEIERLLEDDNLSICEEEETEDNDV